MEEEQNARIFYYYLRGTDTIHASTRSICDDDKCFPQLTALTNEEEAWYLSHAGASAHEVKRLCTDKELFESQHPLQEYKSEVCGRLSFLGDSRLNALIPRDKLIDALLGLQEEPLDTNLARGYRDRIRYYKEVREAIKKEQARVRLLIAAAGTHEEVETVYAGNHIDEISTGKEDWSDE